MMKAQREEPKQMKAQTQMMEPQQADQRTLFPD